MYVKSQSFILLPKKNNSSELHCIYHRALILVFSSTKNDQFLCIINILFTNILNPFFFFFWVFIFIYIWVIWCFLSFSSFYFFIYILIFFQMYLYFYFNFGNFTWTKIRNIFLAANWYKISLTSTSI